MRYFLTPILSLLTILVYGQQQNSSNCPYGQIKVKDREGKEHWKCADIEDPLPITLTSFKAITKIHHIQLIWTVGNVINHSHYQIYRSYTGNHYELIGETTQLSFNDRTINQPAYYYLVDISNTGVSTKHQVIYINFNPSLYVVYNLQGKLMGVYNNYQDIPKGVCIINNTKVNLL